MIPIRDNAPSRHFPIVTVGLIGANLAVFLFELSLAPDTLRGFFNRFGLIPLRYSHPEWAEAYGFPGDLYLPFLSSMFLHGGWMHLIGNMWTLWIFGDNVEDRMGAVRYVLFYLGCGVAAALVQFVSDPYAQVPTVGASGAIAGVMGAYFVMFPRARILMLFPIFFYPLFFVIPAFLYLIYWFAIQVLSGAWVVGSQQLGGVAWWAHAGGFLTGAVLHGPFLNRRRRRRPRGPSPV